MSDHQEITASSVFVYVPPKKKKHKTKALPVVEPVEKEIRKKPTELMAIEMELAAAMHRLAYLESKHHEALTTEDFEPIRKLVYGIMSMIGVSIVAALLSLGLV